MDHNKKAVGVLQAINKNQGVFGKDDEGLLNIIASLADIVLKNTLSSEQQSQVYLSLRSVLKMGINIFSVFGIDKLIRRGEEKLMEIMNVSKAKILICDYSEN